MGMLHSIPFCSRVAPSSTDREDNAVDKNNNEPNWVVGEQPLAASSGSALSIIGEARPVVDEFHDPDDIILDRIRSFPDATSTPRSITNSPCLTSVSNPNAGEFSDDQFLDDDDDIDDEVGPVVDRVVGGSGSEEEEEEEFPEDDSGLENSRNIDAFLLRGRFAVDEGGRQTPTIDSDSIRNYLDDEGVYDDNADLLDDDDDTTINVEDTSSREDEEVYDDDEVQDPLERPPEPTLPEGDVINLSDNDCCSSNGSDYGRSSNRSSPERLGTNEVVHCVLKDKRQMLPKEVETDPTTNAISEILSDLVGDRPTQYYTITR